MRHEYMNCPLVDDETMDFLSDLSDQERELWFDFCQEDFPTPASFKRYIEQERQSREDRAEA